MKIKSNLLDYESIIEASNDFTVAQIINNHNLLTEQLRRYFSRLCNDNNAHSEETAYPLNVDAPYAFALPAHLTHGWDGVYEVEGDGQIFFYGRISEQWENFDDLYLDELVVILMSVENIPVLYES